VNKDAADMGGNLESFVHIRIHLVVEIVSSILQTSEETQVSSTEKEKK